MVDHVYVSLKANNDGFYKVKVELAVRWMQQMKFYNVNVLYFH